ncbi:MAG: efflux RND transporter periplasmic adaptor subunit [Vicinamibacterales bacterium]
MAASCSGSAGTPVEAQAGPYALTAHLNPDPPKQNGGSLHVAVRDGSGAHITGADVSVGYFMPAMGSMAEMRGNLGVRPEDEGTYVATLDFPMTGSWRLDVAVSGAAGRGSASYRLTVGAKGLTLEDSSGTPAGGAQSRTLTGGPYESGAYESLTRAFAAYEEARAALASDNLGTATPAGTRAAEALGAAVAASRGDDPRAAVMVEAQRTAQSIAAAADLERARSAFGELTRTLLILASVDPRLSEGLGVWACPMTTTFPKWFQREGEKGNPYMGQAMPTCGDASDWAVAAPESEAETLAHAQAAHGAGEGDEVAYYTCSMHPSVQSATEGTCPICGMDLVPVTRQEAATATIRIDASRRQEIGVRTERVTRQALSTQVRAVGKVVFDETRLSDVTLRIGGWIGRLDVNEPGQHVRQGQTLFTLYSPNLYAAQQEFLTAVSSQRTAAATAAPQRADYLVEAARTRLRLWDLSQAQVDQVAETGKPIEYLPILAPASGYVVEKNVVAGSSVRPGDRLFRIAGIDQVWVEAEVYESDLPVVAVGQTATVTLPYAPGQTYTGRVSFIYPYLEGATRTARVRIALANPKLAIKPDMYAEVTIQRNLGERLTVPEQAVLYAGQRSFVFLDLGEGRLRPNEVKTGLVTGDRIEILSGLAPGDVIVTSGNFLVAAEARLKLAMEQWR